MLKMVGKFALVASVAAVMVACGGKNDPAKVASSNLVISASPAVASAFIGQSFTLPGVPALGTSASTTLAIGGSATAQTAVISSGGLSATTNLTYGSCIFTVTASNFPATSALGVGKTVTVNPCTFTAKTAGQTSGTTLPAGVSINLGGVASADNTVAVTVALDGSVTVAGVAVGTVPTVVPSGSGGG